MSGHQHAKARGQWLWIYHGRDLAFVLKHRDDGWRVIDHPKREIVGTFATRELAIAFANARIAAPAAAPIAGERERDAQHVKRIRKHQRHAEARRARNSHSQPRQRGRTRGGEEKSLSRGEHAGGHRQSGKQPVNTATANSNS